MQPIIQVNIGMKLGAGINAPAGQANDVIYWTAGKSFSNFGRISKLLTLDTPGPSPVPGVSLYKGITYGRNKRSEKRISSKS